MTPADSTRAIIRATASRHGSSYDEVVGRSQFRCIELARRACMRAVADARIDLSTTQIGRYFDRDHSTVLYALGRLRRKPVEPIDPFDT